MKSRYTFEFMNLDDCQVAVPIGESANQFHGVLKVNDTGVAILKLLAQETNEEKLVNDLMEEYTGNAEDIRGYVHEFLGTLKAEGLVE